MSDIVDSLWESRLDTMNEKIKYSDLRADQVFSKLKPDEIA